ncbi:MAG: glycoside hydrolase family 9 protein, partial [Anaerolineae bacterium]|nr:glycoside hydrolase family 9 protein [Anaerolineae bacterium]
TQGIVFATEDGWGFEAAVPISGYLTPEHGLTIGFQAHANGASSLDRDVKLIWSLADTADTSYQDPGVFGQGIFFEVGQTDIPEPTVRPEPVVAPSERVSVNQVGYFTSGQKRAVMSSEDEFRTVWSLIDTETNEMVFAGTTSKGFVDEASGETVRVADFSEFTTPGTYILMIDNLQSAPFEISDDLYSQIKVDALRYFYLNRSGIDLEAVYAGEWARPAGHLSDSAVTCYAGTDADGMTWEGCDYTLDAGKGWYDAGDYGKYVVNGGISVWTLLNLYELYPDVFADDTLNIPESGNGVPDILDEVRWELEFLLGMQVPDGEPLAGMAHHKLHDLEWAAIPFLPPAEAERYLFPPTTAATLNLAANAAQCARIWQEIDAEFATRCLTAAEKAWAAAQQHPDTFIGNTPGAGGGNYPDANVQDEFFWAAAELFITTGKVEYHDALAASPYFENFLSPGQTAAMSWLDTAALGTISLVSVTNDLSEAEIATLREQIIAAADGYLDLLNSEGYLVPLSSEGYVWGSNSSVLNNALVIAMAYHLTDDSRYWQGVTETADYILGRNALAKSFVSGYGTDTPLHPHHRFWANDPALGYPPPPPGVLVGGPNANPDDPAALNADVMQEGFSQRYVDHIGSYSTNEVTINWNAPFVWVTTFLDTEKAQ